ncbi:MAG: paraquat-inducible protein A [Candidatus Scalindua sp. AMX11]|nr:MAG: paraquat-inducible protein A [Candidatus Scalindua sp.]RZV90205.1 MAG: paraquat-inducible protein A [Candidatus Scalindua sp. SCAELEC01]TDE64989.1 MAG: paraquat-inducible protein A [Candidatus Scalindua sp. AMX11]
MAPISRISSTDELKRSNAARSTICEDQKCGHTISSIRFWLALATLPYFEIRWINSRTSFLKNKRILFNKTKMVTHFDISRLTACHACDLLIEKPYVLPGNKALCPRCSTPIYEPRVNTLNRTLALVIVGLILLWPAIFFPILNMTILGNTSFNTLIGGVVGMYQDGFYWVAFVVLFASILAPVAKLIILLIVLLQVKLNIYTKWLPSLFRFYGYLGPWGMLEVYMIGVLISVTKLVDLADLHMGIGLFCFVGLLLTDTLATLTLDKEQVWKHIEKISGRKAQLTSKSAGLISCHDCHKLLRYPEIKEHQKLICPRCGANVHKRRPGSLTKTWALVITALICLIPANMYPIMTLVYRGQGEPSTIIAGVLLLVKEHMIPIALVVFIASIAVPFLKIAGLIWLLLSVQFKWNLRRRQRTIMYRAIEAIGRWSMLDIFVISILVTLVNLGSLAEITGGLAGTFFCAAVVMTMLAAVCFDPRLIWDE